MNSFYTAMFQANNLYGTDFEDEDAFAEIALIAWNMIGNKQTRLYRFFINFDCTNNLEFDLPCNCDEEMIESVTAAGEDWDFVDGAHFNGDINALHTEHYIESRKRETHPLYSHGHYIHYEIYNNKIRFFRRHPRICILYRGVILDDEGLPMLTEKETNAIAAFCAYSVKYKEALKTQNTLTMQFAMALKKDWNSMCDEARVPSHITLNETDEILNAKSSWDRKIYNKSYKYLKH